jgi:hypothetical protein
LLGQDIPHQGAGAVLLHKLAIPVQVTEIGFRQGMAFASGSNQPLQPLLRILLYALAPDIHQAKRILRAGVAIG